MKIEVSDVGGVCVVALAGRLDTTNYNEVEVKMNSLFSEQNTNIIFDLKELDYISSSGLRVMLMTLKRVGAAGGKLVLCNMQEGIREIFEISGFTTIFTIAVDRESALKHF
jgi:anti-sigma B factor antagonist